MALEKVFFDPGTLKRVRQGPLASKLDESTKRSEQQLKVLCFEVALLD